MTTPATPPADDPYRGQAPGRYKCMRSYSDHPLCQDRACLTGCQYPNLRFNTDPEQMQDVVSPVPPPLPQETTSMSANPRDPALELAAKDGKRTAAGRRDSDGQEKTPEPKLVEKSMPDLIKLYEAKVAAAEALSQATKKCAEKAGFNTGALKKFIKARAESDGSEEDQFDDRKREAEQLVLLFEHVGAE